MDQIIGQYEMRIQVIFMVYTYYLYVIVVINLVGWDWGMHLARQKWQIHAKSWSYNPKQRNYMGDLGIDDRIILQWMFKNEASIEDNRIMKYNPKEGDNLDCQGCSGGNNWRRIRFLNMWKRRRGTGFILIKTAYRYFLSWDDWTQSHTIFLRGLPY
jgi:hypothetical protein